MAYLALDLGAGSGRAIAGTIRNGIIYLEEIHRFSTPPVKLDGTIYWNFLSLHAEIKESLRLAVKKGITLDGIAVDTWGVDFGLLDRNGRLIANPVCYRDSRTEGMPARIEEDIPRPKLYSITGIQEIGFNTLYQIYSLKLVGDISLSVADRLLFIPDLVNYFLTGTAVNEYTIASTSQFLDARTREWSEEVFDRLELPLGAMGKIVQPGTLIGNLKAEISEETGAGDVKVFAAGSHDTASAIAALPAAGPDCAFVSSGTWSLFGLQIDEPILTEKARLNDFTNEGGCNGKILFMRNITGLWLLQRLIADWEKDEGYVCDYKELLTQCDGCEPFRSIVNNDDPAFTFPVSMVKAMQEYCARTNQPVPESKGQLVRCALESLALKYHFTMKSLNNCCGREIKKLHVAGGGGKNDLLNQYTANALGIEVITGLAEATAIGNIMAQAIADKQITDWNEAHAIIENSFEFTTYQPQNTTEWEAAAEKFAHLFT